jgi:hypothetical protein
MVASGATSPLTLVSANVGFHPQATLDGSSTHQN